jgi:hypothetical protein
VFTTVEQKTAKNLTASRGIITAPDEEVSQTQRPVKTGRKEKA